MTSDRFQPRFLMEACRWAQRKVKGTPRRKGQPRWPGPHVWACCCSWCDACHGVAGAGFREDAAQMAEPFGRTVAESLLELRQSDCQELMPQKASGPEDGRHFSSGFNGLPSSTSPMEAAAANGSAVWGEEVGVVPEVPVGSVSYLGLPLPTDARALQRLLTPDVSPPVKPFPSAKDTPSVFHPGVDRQLVHFRLGVASALFETLKLKSPALGAHCLRVALAVSGWAENRGMDPQLREVAEIAALLHDIGMVGLPDRILLKPGPLEPAEAVLVEESRRHSAEILRAACGNEQLIVVVEHVGRWFDGSRGRGRLLGTEIPVPARMITIAEAFDAMTNHQVYRPAMSMERAVAELFACAGTQFDPELVQEFASEIVRNFGTVRTRAAARWLGFLDPQTANCYWLAHPPEFLPQETLALFPGRLLEQMRDGVIFVDAAGRIVGWNPAAERLSGINGSWVLGRTWFPELLGLTDERGEAISLEDCPVQAALSCGAQSLRRLTLRGRSGRQTPVDFHVIPVPQPEGSHVGAVVIMHDASPEASLEAECHRLQARTSLDPLTQLANRAELDRLLPAFVAQHQRREVPCSLIVCDLDHFKQINDTFGHQAGDAVIKAFASVLKSAVRPGDLAARYGGEEFVLLCAHCDNRAAAERAEQIRFRFAQIPHPCLDHKTATASFGVTELQPGDTPESFFRRADRALMQAKINGRNQVVQLGIGSERSDSQPGRGWFRSLATKSEVAVVLRERLRVPGPMMLVVEKLQGFVSDHQARVLSVRDNHVELEVTHRPIGMRRQTDRPVVLRVQLGLRQLTGEAPGQKAPSASGRKCTVIDVEIQPATGRERRRRELLASARHVLEALQAYLMAQPEPTSTDKSTSRLPLWLGRWLGRK